MSVWEYLRKELKLSAKTVFSQYPRYLSFAALLLLISLLFCSVSTLHYNHQKTQRAYLESRYVNSDGNLYHFQLLNCTQDQYLLLRQFDREQTEENEVFKIVGGVESTISGTENKRYDLDIQLIGDIDSAFETFKVRYTEALDEESTNYTVSKTPLLNYELSVSKNTAVYIFQLIVIASAGAAAVWVLHSTMTNHFKFTYGIYMTFGATFKRLFFTAFWEQFWIVLITWLPAALISTLVSWGIFRKTGLSFTVYWGGVLLALLLTLITVGVAVLISVRSTSAKTPSSLIVAADNSNLIHSPRISSDLIGGRFPTSISRLSFRRYVKYILRLMAGALSFAMLFVSASTIGYCYQRVLSLEQPELSVDFDIPSISAEEKEDGITDFSAYGYNAEKSDVFSELPYIKTILKQACFQASGVCSHVKISSKIPKMFAGGVRMTGILTASNTSGTGFMNVNYCAMDEEVIESFETLGYQVEGSLASVLNEERTVAVTEGFLGSKKFDWHVGDTIYVADLPDAATQKLLTNIANNYLVADMDDLLTAWLEEEVFSYTAYTVGAIISELPTGQNWAIYFSETDYSAVTGFVPIYNELKIYVDENTSEEEVSTLYYQLRHVADYYTNMTVTNLDVRTAHTVEVNKNYTSIIQMMALVLLAVCPLIWIFSQILFYQKRQQELELLQAMGASTLALKRYILGDAFRFALTGGLLFALLAPAVSWLIHRLIGYIMIFAGGTMLASFRLPVSAYVAGILLNLLLGFISSYLAWILYQKRCPAVYTDLRDDGNVSEQTNHKEGSV